MKKTINGKCFDTETAAEIISTHYGYVGEKYHYFDTLFKSNDDEYFLHRTRFIFPIPVQSLTRNTMSDEIISMSLDEAKDWCREYFGNYECEDIFGSVA